MSNATLREAPEACAQLLEHLEPEVRGGYSPDGALSKARAALAADDAARGTMQDAGWAEQAVSDCFATTGQARGTLGGRCFLAGARWQASRAAAPRSVEPVGEITIDELVTLVGEDIAPMIDAGTLVHTIGDTQSTACEVTASDVAVARALLFCVSGSALLDGDKKAIIDAGMLYRMVCTANNLLIGRLAPPTAPTDAEWREETIRTHELKTDPEVFQAVLDGIKTYEIRNNDRDFAVGDALVLRETLHRGMDMATGSPLVYTGRKITRRVSHVLNGPIYGLAAGWAILSLGPSVALRAHIATRPAQKE